MKNLSEILAAVDVTYSNLPRDLQFEVENLARNLAEIGPRKRQKSGLGTEFFQARDFMEGIHQNRDISARLSLRVGRPIVVEKEFELRQHFFLWRDASPSMDYTSSPKLPTKKQAAEVMLLSLARHLSWNEEQVGLLDSSGSYRGSKADTRISGSLLDVSVVTGGIPLMQRKLPRNSTIVLFSDFLDFHDEIEKQKLQDSLSRMHAQNMKGFAVMVLDPEEMDFAGFSGTTIFEGLEGEGRRAFENTESLGDAYRKLMTEHRNEVESLCAGYGFELIVQRTDKPLHQGIMRMLGVGTKAISSTEDYKP